MMVCMLLKRGWKDFKSDSRVLREAYALKCAGYDVTVAIYGIKDKTSVYNGINLVCPEVPGIKHFEKYNIYGPGYHYTKRNIFQKIINKFIGVFYNTRYFKSLYNTAFKVDAPVYHCHDYETLAVGYRLKKSKGSKLVYDSHELWMESVRYIKTADKILKNLLLINLERKYIKSADAVITVCQSIAMHLSKRYMIGMPYVLRNLPDSNRFVECHDYFRNEFKIPCHKKIVLYQGALMKGRGLIKLIDAWERVNPNIVLVIMGSGPLMGVIKDDISRNGLNGRVFLKDPVDPSVLLQYTMSADAGICPIENVCLSYYYASPNKMWEYIAAGIPVLASSFPEMGDFLCSEGMGLSFDIESCGDIANKINHIFDKENTALYTAMKQNCIEKSETVYNWENEKFVLLDVYKTL